MQEPRMMKTQTIIPDTQATRTIGIIGGGQLGRMLAMAASRLGFKTIVLEPDMDCPAAQLASAQIIAAYDDGRALDELAERVDVVTYEFENVPVGAVRSLVNKVKLFPPPQALEISQDRLAEKEFFARCAIATAPYWRVDNEEDLRAAMAVNGSTGNGATGILKTRRLGYDGKGQVRMNDAAAAAQAIAAIGHAPAILEGFVDFAREISVLAVRSQQGDVVFFDIPENTHRDGILRQSSVPAAIDAQQAADAKAHTSRLMAELNYVGTLALEFFVTRDGKLIANEFAPRVHNSGHWTEAACCVSQFDLHIRAITGMPLVTPHRHSDCVMENLIGDDVERLPELLKQQNLLIHLYGKQEMRAGRKMGHFTRIVSAGANL